MRDHGPQSGLSSAEVIVMATIMSVLMIMITESMTTLTGVRGEQRALFSLGDVADGIARRIEKDLDFATRIFSDTTIDSDYLRAMDLGFDPLAAGWRLPKLTAHGYFEADAPGSYETGNILFIARRGPRVSVKYETVSEHHIQSLRFHVYLPIDQGTEPDLACWLSDPVVDYWDVADIADPTARADVLVQLYDNGVRYAWDATSPRASGLHEITAAGGLQALAVDKFVTGAEAPAQSRPLKARHMRLSPNGASQVHAVPAYAHASGNFPGGFEIKLDGALSGKLVLLRMVTQSTHAATQQVFGELQRFISTQG